MTEVLNYFGGELSL